jgi:hypothetical protein
MFDEKDIIKNISTIYDSNTNLRVLKDFERVFDELNIYVFKNWESGELVSGPKISRHWVECSFMWPYEKMPDPRGGKILTDYNCKISYSKDKLKKPRQIKNPADMRPNSKKGYIDEFPIWIVHIKMPKQLMFDIFKGSTRGKTEENVDINSLYKVNDSENMQGVEQPPSTPDIGETPNV